MKRLFMMVFVICIFISACSFEESNVSDELVSTLVEESYYSKNDDEVENKKEQEEVTLKFIPYYAFANRGDSDMLVWVRQK